ncbi:MAG: heavy metal transporter [Peptoclostridium sp.]|uniref:urease accessory protein UreH domain-containing protein n=1 Tax=Peptoclostridium sp. TaxID=1904860 RepID=UPI00139D0D7A|nr:sulfite exporter TauE/SafE family protein [Peptoclostridium sp.]MZQ75753.1 heavy metal transporter [Peptoclostridium sp.]
MGEKLNSRTIVVYGMTCSSCEMRIERALKKMDGVKKVRADNSKSNVTVAFDEETVTLDAIKNAIEAEGYSVKNGMAGEMDTGKLSTNQVLGIGIVVLAVYMIIKSTVGFNFIPEVDQSMGYGILFLVGALTSLHCVAMCGGINVSQCAVQVEESYSGFSKLKPSLLYNLGRVVSYTVIGGIVGALGSVVSFSGHAKGIVAVLAGLFMVIMGLNMLGIAPWARRFVPRMPRFLANNVAEGRTGKGPFYIGLLSGFMPCGPLQSMQLYALGTGSLVSGAMSMLAFSLGTVPLMFGLGAVSTMLSRKLTNKMIKVGAALVVILGLVMMGRGLSLSGVSMAFPGVNSENVESSGAVAALNGDVQEVTIDLQSSYYEPIIVQKGIKVRFNIRAAEEDINGCNGALQVPEFGIQKQLVPGDNIIEFTPTEDGTFPYSCWMGMIRSSITVVPSLDDISEQEVNKAAAGPGENDVPPCCIQ